MTFMQVHKDPIDANSVIRRVDSKDGAAQWCIMMRLLSPCMHSVLVVVQLTCFVTEAGVYGCTSEARCCQSRAAEKPWVKRSQPRTETGGGSQLIAT